MADPQDIPPDDETPAVRVVEQTRCTRCGKWLSTNASKARTMGDHCARAVL